MRRKIKHLYQRITRGFDDGDTFSLDSSIATYTLPRLKRFKEIVTEEFPSYPSNMTSEEWIKILDEMIWFFEQYSTGEIHDITSKVYTKRMQKAAELFGKHFMSLWW